MTQVRCGAVPTNFGVPGFKAVQAFNSAEHGFNLSLNEHAGAHVEAAQITGVPIHRGGTGGPSRNFFMV